MDSLKQIPVIYDKQHLMNFFYTNCYLYFDKGTSNKNQCKHFFPKYLRKGVTYANLLTRSGNLEQGGVGPITLSQRKKNKNIYNNV